MLISYKRGQGSIVLRVKILNSSVTTGAGLTGLSSSSGGLIISTIADNESTATTYTQAGSTIESITTLGTYAAPTATKCRFKEVDANNHKGIYEIQLADTRFAGGKSLLISISGATNLAECDAVVPLTDLDPYDSTRAGLSALPNAAAAGANGLWILGSNNTAAITIGALTTGNVTYNAFTVTNNFLVSGNFTVTGTTTHTGAVSFGSTFAVTGTVTYNAFTVTAATTFTGAVTATHASNDIRGITVAALANGAITAASIASGALVAAVWDGAISGHTTSGTFGAALNAAGSAGDPWATALPGAYGAGTAGYIVGNGISATFSAVGVVQAKTDLINTAAFWAGAFTINSTKVYADAVSGSVVKEIASNASGGGGTIGPGSIAYTVTVTDDVPLPLAGALCWVSTDEDGANVIAGTLYTNAFGLVTFMLNAGTYYLWVSDAGYNGTNPTVIVVS